VSGATTRPNLPSAADPELDRRWLEGREGALEEAHGRYRSRLEGVAYRIVGNHADAEDVVQRVFQALPGSSYRGTASLWSYLYRAAVNGSVNLLRGRRRRRRLESEVLSQHLMLDAAPAPASNPEAQILEGEILAAVAKALLEVKPRHRQALVLRIHHGLTNTEIAGQLDVPLATIGTWLRRGREELRASLAPLLRDMEKNE
jgi:RNA polymerase sigma-70 factor (ECF subfamily)